MTNGDGGSVAPPGWYPDGEGWQRRWDGFAWTDDRRPTPSGPPPARSPWEPPGPGGPNQPAGPPPAPPTAYRPGGPSAAGWPSSGGIQGPAYAGSAYGGPSYGPTPGPRRNLLWLWIVLGLVLVVIIGAVVTLLVAAPWDEEDDEGGSSAPTTPSPVVEGTVGDVDGDGLGDVVGRYYDSAESRLVLTNTDGAFTLEQTPTQEEEHLFVADYDGDGTSEVGSWFGSAATLRFEVEGGDMQAVTADFTLWPRAETVAALVGDVDGDGLPDVVAWGQMWRSQVVFWVLRNNGEGFDAPVRWGRIENATFGSVRPIVGDYDGDGDADLVSLVPNQPIQKGEFDDLYWYGDFGVRGLVSTGSSFEVGEVRPTPTEIYDREVTVGDFDGDGVDTVVVDDYLSGQLVFFGFDGTQLRPTGQRLPYQVVGDGLLEGLTAVDVDGNGLDDLVFSNVDVDDYSFSGAWVAVAQPEGVGEPTRWADIPDCTGDYCEVEFFPAS